VAVEQSHQESAERAAALAELFFAEEQCCRESVELAAALAALVLAKEQCCRKFPEINAALAALGLAKEQQHYAAAEQAAVLERWPIICNARRWPNMLGCKGVGP
jgi:hypothetical protein